MKKIIYYLILTFLFIAISLSNTNANPKRDSGDTIVFGSIGNDMQGKIDHWLEILLIKNDRFSKIRKAESSLDEITIEREKLISRYSKFSKFVSIDYKKNEPTIGVLMKVSNPSDLIKDPKLHISGIHEGHNCQYITSTIKIKDLEEFIIHPDVILVEVAKKLIPLLETSTKYINADAVWHGSLDYKDDDIITGRNVYVGIIEQNQVLWDHKTFIDDFGNNRINSIWIGGTSYNFPNFPAPIFPAKSPEHATHVTGIASGDGDVDNRNLKGIAHQSDILFACDISFSDNTLTTNSVLNAYQWMVNKSINDSKPLVVNMSIGAILGPHDGTTLFEEALNQKIEHSSTIFVNAAGNESRSESPFPHFYGIVPDQTGQFLEIDIEILNNSENEFVLEFWHDSKFDVQVSDNDVLSNREWSEIINYSQVGSFVNYDPLSDDFITIVNSSNSSGGVQDNNSNSKVIAIFYDGGADNEIGHGTFKIRIFPHNEGDGGKINGYHSSFNGLDFCGGFKNGDNFQSLLIPNYAENVISVGSYENIENADISEFSSLGPSRIDNLNNVSKPDITAPGSLIKSSIHTGEYGKSSGTSMAAPHVTGAIALLLQNFPDLTAGKIKDILKVSAGEIPDQQGGTKPVELEDQKYWGAGKLDIHKAFESMVGYTDVMCISAFVLAYNSRPEHLQGLPIEKVDENWVGLSKQAFTNGAMVLTQGNALAFWLGEGIWNKWIELNSVNSEIGLPISTEYLDVDNNNYPTVDFENGQIFWNGSEAVVVLNTVTSDFHINSQIISTEPSYSFWGIPVDRWSVELESVTFAMKDYDNIVVTFEVPQGKRIYVNAQSLLWFEMFHYSTEIFELDAWPELTNSDINIELLGVNGNHPPISNLLPNRCCPYSLNGDMFYILGETGISSGDNWSFTGVKYTLDISSQTTSGEKQYFLYGEPGTGIWPAIVLMNETNDQNTGSFSHLGDDIQPILTGKIAGIITDEITNQPIQFASISATDGYSDPDGTDENGNYEIDNVPVGRGYIIEASANGYQKKELAGVEVKSGQISSGNDLVLTPSQVEQYEVIPLKPDVNPNVSSVEKGGMLYRYYKVIDKITGATQPNAVAEVPELGYNALADKDGILKIGINSISIGDGEVGANQNFTITKVNNKDLATEDIVTFSCKIKNRKYDTVWSKELAGKLGVGLAVDGASQNVFVLRECDANFEGEDSLFIDRKIIGSAGVGIGIGAGLNIDVGVKNFQQGAFIGLGANAVSGPQLQDHYRFDNQFKSVFESMAMFCLVVHPFIGKMNPFLTNVLAGYEVILTGQSNFQDACYELGSGMLLKVGGEASGNFNIGTQNTSLVLRANAGVEADVIFSAGMLSYPAESYAIGGQFEVCGEGKFDADLKSSFNFIPKLDNNISWCRKWSKKFELWDMNKTTKKYEYGGFKVKTKGIKTTEIEVTLTYLGGDNQPYTEDIIIFKIQYEAANILHDIFRKTNLGNLVRAFNAPEAEVLVVGSQFAAEFIFELFDEIFKAKNKGHNIRIYYEFRNGMVEYNPKTYFDIKVGLGVTANVTLGQDLFIHDVSLTERGRWIGDFFVLEKYENRDNIPSLSERTKLNELMEDITDDLTDYTSSVFDETFEIIQNGVVQTIEAGKAVFIKAENAVETGVVKIKNWFWGGNSSFREQYALTFTSQLLRKAIMNQAQEIQGLKFGIGGFYRMEPLNYALLEPCSLSIAYDDSEVVDIDESALAIYKWDENNTRWVVVGGEVFPDSNKVVAVIDSFKTYTLAPRMPYGSFGLQPEDESIPADSASLTKFTSIPILNNNGELIEDGTQFTIICTGGYLLAEDLNSELDGCQIGSVSGELEFDLMSGYVAMPVTVYAQSVDGKATLEGQVTFVDEVPPNAPTSLDAQPLNEGIRLNWKENTEIDIAGYLVYYDTDNTEPPFNGTASIWGKNSPIDAGSVTEAKLTGLSNDSTYYITLRAYDVSGNLSDYADVISANPAPYAEIDYYFPVDNGSWYMVGLPLDSIKLPVDSLFPSAANEIVFDWENNAYVQKDSMQAGKGYWLAMPEYIQNIFFSRMNENYVYHFNHPGWYMITGPTEAVGLLDPNVSPDGSIIIPAYTWDYYTNSYLQSYILSPGTAYWIAVLQECDLNIGGDPIGPSALKPYTSKMSQEEFNRSYGAVPPTPPNINWQTGELIVAELPTEFKLYQNYPNPFNPETTIKFDLPKDSYVEIVIYNILGQKVKTLVNDYLQAGNHTIVWNGMNEYSRVLSSGVFLCFIKAGEFRAVNKLLFLK